MKKTPADEVVKKMKEIKNPQDYFVFFDTNSLYKFADQVRDLGFHGNFPTQEDYLFESDRDKAKEFVKKHYGKLNIASKKEFANIPDAKKFLENTDEIWVLKSNIEEENECDQEVEEAKMRGDIEQVLAREPEAVIPWTARQMAVAKFLPHLRNEFAIHRWDVVGDDDTSAELLAQPDLTEHAVSVLGQILVRRGHEHDPAPHEDFHVRLCAENASDVRLVVEAGQAGLQLTDDPADEPYVELDAAARTPVIWGRRPAQRGRGRVLVVIDVAARQAPETAPGVDRTLPDHDAAGRSHHHRRGQLGSGQTTKSQLGQANSCLPSIVRVTRAVPHQRQKRAGFTG